ncbi:MAG: monovalent cation/H(+) antiporter subunit G [Eubacteriales bacterium]|nr:monovalent cation/H(+) antiporter subunit G [Eubacteriales bacterium]
MREVIAYFFFSAGLLFMLIGLYGIWKNQSFFVSITVSSLLDTMGFLCFGIGLVIYLGWQMISLKVLFLIGVFMFLNPLASHMLAKAANTAKTAPQKEGSK